MIRVTRLLEGVLACCLACGSSPVAESEGGVEGSPRDGDGGLRGLNMDSGDGPQNSVDAGNNGVSAIGTLTTLASGQNHPLYLAIDSATVYWTNAGSGSAADGSVVKVPKDGGAVTMLAAGLVGPGHIVVDETNAYWTSATVRGGKAPGQNGTVAKVALQGGTAPATLGTYGGYAPEGIAVDSANVYWANSSEELPGAVMKMPLDGGPASILTSGQMGVFSIAIDAANIYWTNQNDGGAIMEMPLVGGTPLALTSGQTGNAIAVNATSAFWTNVAVIKVALDGGPPLSLAAGTEMIGIALDDAYVYWTSYDGGTVKKVPLGGGAPITLATGQRAPVGIAVDATSVYWTNSGCPNSSSGPCADGAIMKLTPK
jgi:hypothetical protein